MIRRDYIVQMVEEFVRAIMRIRGLRRDEKWQEADREIENEIKRLFGKEMGTLESISETEMLARLIESDSAAAVKEKVFILTTLLKEMGDAAGSRGETARARALYLKSLHLLLDSLNRGEAVDPPEYVPRLELFLNLLADDDLPLHTYALLMQYYERIGNFAKAEDALYEMLDAQPDSPELVQFGVSFYHRLLSRNDLQLEAGSLPREEVEAGLSKLSP
jgi:tetratricopeptide (TPR) repeat protein